MFSGRGCRLVGGCLFGELRWFEVRGVVRVAVVSEPGRSSFVESCVWAWQVMERGR